MSDKGQHLVVLVHGLWGNYKHMSPLIKALKRITKDTNDNFTFFAPMENSTFKTFDGIEIVGYRTLLELCEFIKEQRKSKDVEFDKLSVIGYSMGGLISRFLIGKMYGEYKDIFNHMEPQVFMTFATPHLGVQFYNPLHVKQSSILHPALRFLGSTLLGKTGREMFITNPQNDTIVKLSEGEYLQSLSKFKWRVVFANVKNDRTVAFYTAFITDRDPFIGTGNKLHFSFDTDLPQNSHYTKTLPRIVDMDKLDPTCTYHAPRDPKQFRKWLNVLPIVILSVMIIFPIAIILNFAATLYRYYATRKYRRLLNEGTAVEFVRSKIGINDHLKTMVSNAYESILNDTEDEIQQESNHNYTKEEDGGVQEDDDDMPTQASSKSIDITNGVTWDDFIKKYSLVWKESESSKKFQRLPFDDYRKTIKANLDRLEWIKIPIYVKSINSHGGIIARRGLDSKTAGTSYASVEFSTQLFKYLVQERCN